MILLGVYICVSATKVTSSYPDVPQVAALLDLPYQYFCPFYSTRYVGNNT